VALDIQFDANYIPSDGDSFSVILSTAGPRLLFVLTISPELQNLSWEGLVLESECFLEDFGGYGLSIASQESPNTGTLEVFLTMEETQCAFETAAHRLFLFPISINF